MRGKQGVSAAARHAIESGQSEIQTYQHAVARLTRELKESREQLREEQQRNRKAERELRARLDVAAAPKIEALELIVAERTSDRDDARTELAKNRKMWEAAGIRFRDHFVKHHGMPNHEAFEAAIHIMLPSMEGRMLSIEGDHFDADLPDEVLVARIATLQRVRGMRR